MTRRRELEQHRQTLAETREILSSMKTLAYMETRKLDRGLDAKRGLVSRIKAVAADFLGFYPALVVQPRVSKRVYLVVGSERAFCGDFNQRLLEEWAAIAAQATEEAAQGVAAGRKLIAHLQSDPLFDSVVQGASVAEEIDRTLATIIESLAKLQRREGVLGLTVLYNDPEVDRVVLSEILPPFSEFEAAGPLFFDPPLLNLSPRSFFDELVSHYLFARLHMVLYASLLAENLQRVRHLEGALQHLEKREAELQRRSNTLRQEEIIEEIEVILLSTASLIGVDPVSPDARDRPKAETIGRPGAHSSNGR